MSKRLDPRYLPLRGLLVTVWGCRVEVNKKVGSKMYPLVVSLPGKASRRALVAAWPDFGVNSVNGYTEKELPSGDVNIEASFGFLLSSEAETLIVSRLRMFRGSIKALEKDRVAALVFSISPRFVRILRRKDG